MSCISTWLIAILRKCKWMKLTQSDSLNTKNLKPEQIRKNRNRCNRRKTFNRCETDKLPESKWKWETSCTSETVKGNRQNRFPGNSAIKSVCKDTNIVRIWSYANSGKPMNEEMTTKSDISDGIYIGQTMKMHIQNFNFYWQVIWVLWPEVKSQ